MQYCSNCNFAITTALSISYCNHCKTAFIFAIIIMAIISIAILHLLLKYCNYFCNSYSYCINFIIAILHLLLHYSKLRLVVVLARSLWGTKSPRAFLIAELESFKVTDYIPWFKIQTQWLSAKRDTLCRSQERKAPGQILLHILHHLRPLITLQGSKFNSHAFLRKGTHCVPLRNETPQGEFDCILCMI